MIKHSNFCSIGLSPVGVYLIDGYSNSPKETNND